MNVVENGKPSNRDDSKPLQNGDSTQQHCTTLEHLIEDVYLHLTILDQQDIDKDSLFSDKHFGIPWFPKNLADFDKCSNRVLMYGAELDADHPGFRDPVYRQRRKLFTNLAMNYRHDQPIPKIDYTEEETKTWRTIFGKLKELHPTHACYEYLVNFQMLEKHCGYNENHIPQLYDVNEYLKGRTGFRIRPVAGYLSSRDFLAGLAFRLFHCTQYIRHGDDPCYTPEPDCCHELLGHVPMLADQNFAQFSQEIGLASLGCSDEEIAKLASCYFFSVEFGLCKSNKQLRVFGAGLLSSVAELKHVLSDKAQIFPFDPTTVIQQEIKVTTFQNAYYYAESFEEAKEKLRKFVSGIKKPFVVRYNPYTENVEVLNTPYKITALVSELKGELSIVSNAYRKILKNKDDLGKIQ